ncbi:hypothetical protein [Microbacterium sp. P05]|uniref:COG1470 family protein n=1 Tax=Microbacterium sp. P05 TaxID=3366948 RepID=UPI0037450591
MAAHFARLLIIAVSSAAFVLAGASGATALDAAATTSPAVAAASSSDTTWALQPATPDGADGRVSLRHTIDPGSVADDHVALTNYSANPVRFAVYAGAGQATAEGGFDIAAPSSTPDAAESWAVLGGASGSTPREGGGIFIEVAAESTVVLPLRIAVPETATPGDHPLGIVAEIAEGNVDAVQLLSRVGVRVHLRVSGQIVGAVSPEILSANYSPSWNPFAPGSVEVRYHLVNEGNVRLGADAMMTVAGPFGIARSSGQSTQREILPGQAIETVVTMEVWPSIWSFGDLAVTPTVVGEDAIDIGLAPASVSFTLWSIPWSLIALLVAGACAALIWRRARRRARQRTQSLIDAAVAAATAASETEVEPPTRALVGVAAEVETGGPGERSQE